MTSTLLAAWLLALHFQLAFQQDCGGGIENVLQKGAIPNDGKDDSASFLAMDQDALAGTIFVDSGVYNIAQNITLYKPVSARAGAIFQVGQQMY